MGCAIEFFKKKPPPKSDTEKRFLILGLNNTGKTTILHKLCKKTEIVVTPTQSLNTENIKYKENNVSIWDVSGSATILWKHYFQDTNGIIYVFDTTDKERLEEAKNELIKALNDENLQETPVLVYGNKQDLPGAMKEAAFMTAIGWDDINRKCKLMQMCSALEEKGIFEGFDRLLDAVLKITPKQ